MFIGTVLRRGPQYGFIDCPEAHDGKHVFFSPRLAGSLYAGLDAGVQVGFILQIEGNKPQASDIRMIHQQQQRRVSGSASRPEPRPQPKVRLPTSRSYPSVPDVSTSTSWSHSFSTSVAPLSLSLSLSLFRMLLTTFRFIQYLVFQLQIILVLFFFVRPVWCGRIAMALILQGSASLVSACLNVMYGMILELSDGAAAEFQAQFRSRLQESFF